MRTLLVFLLLCSAAQAQLSFEPIDPGISPHLTEYRDANSSAWWTWGIQLVDLDGDGRLDIYVTTHHAGHGLAYKQGDDIQFSPMNTGFPPTEMPSGRPALAYDFTGNGRDDLVSTSRDHPSQTKLQQEDGTLVDGQYFAGSGREVEVEDLNNNGLLDVVVRRPSWGVTTEYTHINQWPDPSFATATEELPIPEDVPDEIQEHLRSLEGDNSDVKNRYAGPMYWRGDLNGNGREDMIIQYGGSYGGGAYRFGRYLVREESGVLVDVTDTCGIPGHLLPIFPPVDTAGTGRLSVLVGYGSLDECGLYVQNEDGTFARQTDGKTVHQTKTMGRAVYHGSASYFYEPNWLDLDGDGDLDCIISARRLGWLRVYENVEGVLTQRYVVSHWDADGYGIGDLDGDGKLDFVVGHSLEGQSKLQGTAVTVWRNTSLDVPTDPEDPVDPEDPEEPPVEPEDPEPLPLIVRLTIDGVVSEEPVEVLLDGFPVGAPGEELDVIIGVEPPVEPEDPVEPDEPQTILVTPETIELVEQAEDGSSFILQTGQYRPFTLRERNNNTITADGLVHVHGQGPQWYRHAVTIINSQNITIDGLECSGGLAGVGAYFSDKLVVQNCKLRDNETWGLFTSFCDDTLVQNNQIDDNFWPSNPSAGQHGIYISNSAQRPLLLNNRCSGHKRAGIQINADRWNPNNSDPELTGITKGAVVRGNVLTNNRIGLNLDGVVDSLIEHNTLSDSLRLFKEDGAVASGNNVIRHNLVATHRDESAILVRNGSTGNRFEDNFVWLPKSSNSWNYAISTDEGNGSSFISRNNVFHVRSAPFGGGQWGKDARTLDDMGDVGSIVR